MNLHPPGSGSHVDLCVVDIRGGVRRWRERIRQGGSVKNQSLNSDSRRNSNTNRGGDKDLSHSRGILARMQMRIQGSNNQAVKGKDTDRNLDTATSLVTEEATGLRADAQSQGHSQRELVDENENDASPAPAAPAAAAAVRVRLQLGRRIYPPDGVVILLI